eukprot:11320585-Karenia_brevis.AAC.1
MVVDKGLSCPQDFKSNLELLEEADLAVSHAYWLKYTRLQLQDYYQFQKYQDSAWPYGSYHVQIMG